MKDEQRIVKTRMGRSDREEKKRREEESEKMREGSSCGLKLGH